MVIPMPQNIPITSSGSRSPDRQRPRPVPSHVKRMIELMVRGKPDDESCIPLSFIEAGKLAGIAPDRARKWLDRPEVRSALRAERSAFRLALCSGNELTLQRLRDSSPNQMVQLGAVKTLEGIADAEAQPGRNASPVTPGLTVVVVNNLPSKPTTTIDIKPMPEPEFEPEPQPVSIPGWCLPDDDNMS
jgi:hypothetical protein